ncbi:pentatricopeptide repeat-containing protein 2, mitochondrial-like [Oncorhynchus clarkii lewisi]|uniref:pentatricopeptide repeat-containing protein 2, mitochondrial-like n=1 Tax=Oncorhynchus clarkii lewisi TaxID=490388 RepID=UPI0039B8B15D
MPICRGHGHSQRYHEENSNVAFGEFKFGPPFMRLCYELGLEEMAAATLTDKSDVENAQSMFGQIMSTDSRICQNLKVLMLAMAGAVKESLSVLTLALGSSSPAFIKKPEFTQEVVDLVRLRSEDSPLMASVEQAVSHLQQAGQVTQRNLDKMLCHTPMGTKRMPMGIMDERRISQRTLRPLQSTLLSE